MAPWLHRIDPIALQLPEFTVFGATLHPAVHWYGIMYLLGFAAAWWLGRNRVRAGRLPGVDEAAFGDLMFYCMLGVILGGRIGYILFYDFQVYLHDPWQVLKIWEGGMSFHGGLLGVCVATWLWSRRHGLHVFDTIDFVAPLVPPGLGFGRLGNFINGELWGKYTGGDWGVIFPAAEPQLASVPAAQLQALHASGALDRFARHPSPLYDRARDPPIRPRRGHDHRAGLRGGGVRARGARLTARPDARRLGRDPRRRRVDRRDGRDLRGCRGRRSAVPPRAPRAPAGPRGGAQHGPRPGRDAARRLPRRRRHL